MNRVIAVSIDEALITAIGVLAAPSLPHPSQVSQQPHAGEVVGRKGGVANIPSPGRPEMLLQELLADSGAVVLQLVTFPHGKEAADQTHPLELARLVHACVTNSGCFFFQLQPASRWIPAQNPQHPLTLGTPALRPRWQVEVELLDRTDQLLETKSASSSSSCWGSRRWGSPASSCASSRGSSTSTRRAQSELPS